MNTEIQRFNSTITFSTVASSSIALLNIAAMVLYLWPTAALKIPNGFLRVLLITVQNGEKSPRHELKLLDNSVIPAQAGI